MKRSQNTRTATIRLTRGSIIAALYVALTFCAAIFGLSSGVIQFRLSEMLCILPLFLPEAIPGLFVGCILSNLLTGAAFWDVIFGSVATLIGAVGARLLRNLPEKLIWLSTVPTLLANALIVPGVLILAYGVPDSYIFLVLTVGLGELVCACFGGYVLYRFVKPHKDALFFD